MTVTEVRELCHKCHRAPVQESHHILAKSLGGSDASSNLLPVCSACHRKIHPWLNNKGLVTHCKVIGEDELATYYGGLKMRKKNVTLLEIIDNQALGNAFIEIKEKTQSENSQG